jgi:malate dehydrogenase (decarboxylating)
VGAAVVRAAVAEDLAEGYRTVDPKDLASMSEVLYYTEINFTFV